MKPRLLLTAILFAFGAQSGVALAQTSPSTMPANANAPQHAGGEHMKLFRALWSNADTDKDGQLSKSEAAAAKLSQLSDNFDAIDANKDGKISEQELQQWMRSKHKGGHHDMKGEMKPGSDGKPGMPPPPSSAGLPPPQHGKMHYRSPEQRQSEMQERFNKADTNKDGGLSREEIKAAGLPQGMLDNFDRIDTNKDGKITQDEIRAAWQRDRKPAQ